MIEDTQDLKIQTLSFHSLKYYSQISHLILLRYYDDATCVLRKICLDAKAPHISSTPPPTLPWKFNKHVQPNKGLTRQGNGNSEELRCVIARSNSKTEGETKCYRGETTKLKSAVKLQDLLDATRMLVLRTRPGRESDSDPENLEHAKKLCQVEAVIKKVL
ncbi:hypothetical protein IGI04_037500 [Brassica rapa subsp. trilocularis]|uniref:Uncharacterized protein n=1 Tax=Brassica rapa subsp. trilocularis TaxID=1813537 RepID=A0ABQ7LJ86_BRACM|nr:hypothetical protein IGI04_037500 [Brassica rapa subsp. trilocularis]